MILVYSYQLPVQPVNTSYNPNLFFAAMLYGKIRFIITRSIDRFKTLKMHMHQLYSLTTLNFYKLSCQLNT